MSPYLSIVIPVYNSQNYLKQTVLKLKKVLRTFDKGWEIILVNDGSSDKVWDVIKDLYSEDPQHIIAICLTKNYGQHNALMCGFKYASGQYVITMDDDGQHVATDIFKLLNEIESGSYDVVYGVFDKRFFSFWRNIGSFLINFFYQKVFKTRVRLSAFRIIKKEIINEILSYNLNYTFIDGLIAWVTNNSSEVVVSSLARISGKSGYTLSKLVKLSFNLFTNFSLIPLQIVFWLGLLVFIVGSILAFYYLSLYVLQEIKVPGYTSIIIAILIFGGIQMLSLGILGEYIGRVHLNLNKNPQYCIRYCLNLKDKNSI